MGKRLYRAELFFDPASNETIRERWGIVLGEDGEVFASAPADQLEGEGDEVIDAPLITPGFVNAHIHLTDASRTDQVPGREGLVPWVRGLLGSRRTPGTESDVSRTLKEMRDQGTVAIGEVVNDLMTLPDIVESGMATRLIYEMIGSRAAGAGETLERFRSAAVTGGTDRVHFSPGIHAPYSVSLELIDLIVREAIDRRQPTFIHLAEDPAERELYRSGEGEWREFLEDLGVWDGTFTPPGIDPIAYFDRQGYLRPGFNAVHLTDATDDEIELLAARGAGAILSPTSNLHIADRLPPYRTILRAGLRFALGTDGRGSNPSMNVLDEARLLAEAFPDEPKGPLLRALVRQGEEILQLPGLSSVEVGRRTPLLCHTGAATEPTINSLAGAILQEGNQITRIA